MKYLPFEFDYAPMQEDKEFASALSRKFNLNVENIWMLVESVRIQANFLPAYNKASILKHLSQKINTIKAISITTESGTIEIKSSDGEFQYFKKPLQKLKSEVQTDIQKKDKHLFDDIINYIVYNANMFEVFPDSKSKQKLFVGMFKVHFKLHTIKPYTTEDLFTPGTYPDYDHYLISIGEFKKRPSKK
jgi:hypothetical protein